MKEYPTNNQFAFFKIFSFLIFRFIFCILIFGNLPSWAAVENITMTLIPGKDGVAPFDLDDLPGHDSSDNNKIVRTHDRFDYRVSYKALDATQVNLVFTAPVGIYWLAVGANTTVCNGSGGPQITGGGRILTCPRKPSIPLEPLTFPQIESFELPAIASNFPNGQVAEVQITAGTATAISEGITISAKPKSEIFVTTGGPSKGFNKSIYGAFYSINVLFGTKPNLSGAAINTIKGIEAPLVPITLELTDMPPGTELISCASATCSQPNGPGTTIFYTFTNLNNSLVSAASCSGGLSCTGGGVYQSSSLIGSFYEYAFSTINLFTAFGSTYPSGSKNSASLHFQNLGPEKSISGATNYLGFQSPGYVADVTPGYASGFNTCPDSHSCIKFNIDRTIRTDLYMNFHGTFHTPSTNLIFGDIEASTNNPGDGAESVMPGHLFSAMYPVFTSTQAEEASTNVGSCVVWNPAKMNLDGTAILKLGLGTEFFRVSHLGYPNVISSNRILEYSAKTYANDNERKNALCGIAGDGSTDWFTDPNSVPGGITEVSSIRYKYIPPLQPGTVLGLLMPFRRPTTAYSLGLGTLSLAPWFAQFWSDDKPRIPSQYGGSGYSMWGGRVTTVDALFRHKATMTSSVAPGNSLTMTITPIVIGTPIFGIDATVKNAKIRVNMPDTCLEPVEASLPSFGSITTLPNYGLDGIPCTGDSGEKPAVVTFILGDIPAPGGELTPGYQGHAISQNSFSFNVLATANAPVKSVSWTSIDSADNDPTPVFHNNSGSVSISGVAGFLVSKSSSGTTSGKIGPNENFNYIINFGNGGSVLTGKGRFVDVLPFDGDSRGTVGLGSGKMIVTGLSAGMKTPSQGSVSMEVSTDLPSNIEKALLLPNNEDGLTGINWTPYIAGDILPNNVSAVRFTTSSTLNPGYSGFASIQVKAPTIRSSTNTFNNVWGRTEALSGDEGTIKVLNGIGIINIQGLNGGSFKGIVFKDLNENGILDSGEAGIPNSIVSISCQSGACLTAPQGATFSVLTDSNGNYSFEANLVNKIFPNNNLSGSAIANFDGVIAGTWTITEIPPSTLPFVNVSRTVGSINSLTTGQGSGRVISNILMIGNGVGVNYNFGERLAHGKITVTKNPFTIPAGVNGPFSFTFHATCDLPSTGTVYSATLNNFPTINSVDIPNIPAGSNCSISESTPSPPSGFAWANPVISELNPTGPMEAGGVKTVSISNQFLDGFAISKSVLTQPIEVSGQFATYDIEYKIEVINRLSNSQTYTLLDSFGFEPDVEVIGTPTISNSTNVSASLNTGFTGKGTTSNQTIISNEIINSGSVNTPTIESYVIKLRFKLIGFSSVNNVCNNSAFKGLFNTATLNFGTTASTASACADTPSNTPVMLQLKKIWKGGLLGDSAIVPATSGFVTANTVSFQSYNFLKDSVNNSNKISLAPLEVGNLPVIEYKSNTTETSTPIGNRYSTSNWICSDGIHPDISVLPGNSFQIPSESIGRTIVCSITSNAITITSEKTANPPSGSSVGVNDIITYTIRTQVGGGITGSEIIFTDQLDPGLTITNIPSACHLKDLILTCTLPIGTAVGTHSFIYSAKVNSKAVNNKPAGVKNTVSSSIGLCSPCSTSHGLWSAKINKTSNADSKGVYVGDSIQYTIWLEVTGGFTTQEIVITDTRSVGLQIKTLPNNCSQTKLIMTCKLAAGSAAGVYQFTYSALVTDEALDTVSNAIVSNNASCKAICETVSKVIRNVVLRITKSANPNRVKLGDFVRYEILVENLTGPTANNFKIVDKAAPGLSYVQGSAKLIGDDAWKISSYHPLIFSDLNLAKNQKIIISYLMRVGAGTGRGCVNNLAQADDDRYYVTSNPSSICVSRYADPDFEDSRILGLVFNDKNGNGVQDDQEEGLPGVRLVTPSGFVIETDAYGRYHVDGLDPGEFSHGRNFVMMLDETTLTKGGVLTTQNPLVKRVTWAIPVQFNFGVRQQLYKVNLAQMNSDESDTESELLDANDPNNPMRPVPRNKIKTDSNDRVNFQTTAPNLKTKTYIIATDGLFQFGKSDEASIIRPGIEKLKIFAEKIKTEFSSVESIILKAHTDKIGDNEKNLLLSYQRAETIKKLIIQAGVQSKVFDLNGVGSAEPIVKCNGLSQAKTIECLAPNRRFEVVVTGVPVLPKGAP